MSKAKTENFKTLDGDNGGIDWRETDAKDVNGRYSIKTPIREQLAKIVAVLDVILCAPAHLESLPEWLTVLLVLCIQHVSISGLR